MKAEASKLSLLPPQPDCGQTSPNLMTPPEAAKLLQMDHRTLVRWARAGYVPAHPLGEGRRRIWRFFRNELMDWVEAQSYRAKAPLRSAA